MHSHPPDADQFVTHLAPLIDKGVERSLPRNAARHLDNEIRVGEA
jgi:hypothetical protein